MGGISLQSILHYLPSSKLVHSNEEEYSFSKPYKKVFSEAEKSNNSFYKKINEEYYITGPIKFSLDFLVYLDFSSIDYILISTIDELLLLPFILSLKSKFEGRIFSTLPTKQAGFSHLKEFYNLINLRNKEKVFEDIDKNPDYFEENEFLDIFSQKYGLEVNDWTPLFDLKDLDSFFQRIEPLNYQEEKIIMNDILVSPQSSGYGLGSCYWIFKKSGLVFAVITNGCFHNFRHPSYFDFSHISQSKCDMMILANCLNEHNLDMSVTNGSLSNAEILEKNLFDTLINLMNDREMNVMMPVRNMFFVLDILDILLNRFREKNATFFIISESLAPLINYGNANVEYLNPILQKKIYEATPETPFSSYEKLKNFGRIMFFESIYEFQEKNNNSSLEQIIKRHTPSVYIFLDSTMRFGLSLNFLEAFEEIGAKNTMILTDPFLQCKEVFFPFKEKCKSKVIYCPLDHRFTVAEFKNGLLKKVMPKKILIPKKNFHQLKFPGNEESIFLYEEEKEVILGEYANIFEKNNDSMKVFCSGLEHLSMKNFEGEKNMKFVKAEITIEKNTVKKISTPSAKESKYIVTGTKKNEEVLAKIVNSLKTRINGEGSYLFKKYQQKKNNLNEMVGFVLIFENKKNNDFLYLIHQKNKTKVFATTLQEANKFSELISEEFL